eukprot:gene1225-1801_t
MRTNQLTVQHVWQGSSPDSKLLRSLADSAMTFHGGGHRPDHSTGGGNGFPQEEPEAAPQARLHEEPEAAPQARLQEEPEAAPQARLHEEPEAAPQARLQEEPEAAPQARLHEEPEAAPQARLHQEPEAAPQARLHEEPEAAPEAGFFRAEALATADMSGLCFFSALPCGWAAGGVRVDAG